MSLEYDDSAFYFFVLACSTVYLLPTTYSIVDKISARRTSIPAARTSVEKRKLEMIAEQTLFTTGFLIRLFTCACVWGLAVYMLSLVWNDHEIAAFDPFAILGLPVGEPQHLKGRTSEVKKAWKKLTLVYHPDKCKLEKQVCEQMFRKITKAQKTLTDSALVEHYMETGLWNSESFAVSIGLPTYLIDEANHQFIMVIYLLVLTIVFPTVVCMLYTKSKEYGEKNVMNKSYQFYHFMLNEHSTVKSMPEILAGSAEFSKSIPFKPEDSDDVMTLYKTLSSGGQMQKEKCKTCPDIVKANLLLHAHLAGVPVPQKLQSDLREILSQSSRLVEALITLSSQMRWLQTTKNAILFSQMLTQGQWLKDSVAKQSLLQIPHFTEHEVKHVLSGRSGKAIRSAADFARQDPEQRKGMWAFDTGQKRDVDRFLTHLLPDVALNAILEVEGEGEIAERDFVSLKVTMTRNNVLEGEIPVGYVHCPNLPFLKKESWWIMLGNKDSNALIAAKQVKGVEEKETEGGTTPAPAPAPAPAYASTSASGKCDNGNDNVFEEMIQFWAPSKAGTYSFDVYAMSDSYIGVDIHRTIKMEVVPAADLPAYKAHEEDLALDDEPTLFEQVMQENNADEDSDSDDECDAGDCGSSDEEDPE